MIHISCKFAFPLGFFEPENFIRALDLSVCSDDDSGKEVILGKIAGDQLLLADAELHGEDLIEICDQDSQGMYELYTALFERGSEFQAELDLTEPVEHILFL